MRQPRIPTTLVALAFPALAWGAPVPAGEYAGARVSLLPAQEERLCTALVTEENGENLARLFFRHSAENRYEEWRWNDQDLVVTVHVFEPGSQRPDGRMHKEVFQCRATLEGDRYLLQCADPASEDSALGFDARTYWILTPKAGGFAWATWGRPRTEPGEAVLNQTLAFTRVK